MMKKLQFRTSASSLFAAVLVTVVGLVLMSSSGCESVKKGPMASTEPAKVEIVTKFGSMVVMLSDSTPQHRDNFLKFV